MNTVVLIMVLLSGQYQMHDDKFATIKSCFEYAERRADIKSFICMNRGSDPKVEGRLQLSIDRENERVTSE